MSKNITNTASSVMAELCDDKQIVQDVANNISRSKLVAELAEMRVRKSMTQKDVATKMGVSDSKVSRFEASFDDDLRIGDVKAYMHAIDVEASVALLDKSMSTTNQIKHYVFEIERLLTHLTSIAKECGDDRSIVDGISRFRGEVLYNFVVKYILSGKDFPRLTTDDEHEPSEQTVSERITSGIGMVSC